MSLYCSDNQENKQNDTKKSYQHNYNLRYIFLFSFKSLISFYNVQDTHHVLECNGHVIDPAKAPNLIGLCMMP